MQNHFFSIDPDRETNYRCISKEGISTSQNNGRTMLHVTPDAIRNLTRDAFKEISFYLRTAYLEKIHNILSDGTSSKNDRFVAASLLKNAIIASKGIYPLCQDTGTANILAYKGESVFTGTDDTCAITDGVRETYTKENLRYSQMAPLDMFTEKNTNCNIPAYIDIASCEGDNYRFLFIAKGGGSSNKTALFQETKALLNESSLAVFLAEKIKAIGVAACPPYRICVVIGGLTPEQTLKTVKLGSACYLDSLPQTGSAEGHAYRDCAWEDKILAMARSSGLGAQFGGTAFAVEARVIRLPRHAASCPVGIGVSCNADRAIKAKITCDGVFLEELDKNPERFSKSLIPHLKNNAPEISTESGIEQTCGMLSRYNKGDMIRLSGTLIVARDIAHAKIYEMLLSGKGIPEYFKKYPIYYAGPAKTPPGAVTGSFGPTTAQRMDVYLDEFMKNGASLISIAKGNRSPSVAETCRKYGGFYLGTIGGAAALVAQEHIESSVVIDFEELGMEAVRKIVVRDLPAFIM
ncbi:MAG: fumarate hydratase [Spirochaetes bacterium]|nr:fumarate hydratase [Spirochaetota bacterium]